MWKIGDRPWLASVGRKPVEKPCPVCYGKRQVTLIIGNDDSIVLPCQCCASGYQEPSGTVTEYEFLSDSEQLTISEIRTETTADGEKHDYLFYGNRYAHDGELWTTKEEALVECARKCAEIEHDENTRAENIKQNQARTYSWNAGYHLREAKREEKSAARHRKYAVICKQRARESP